MHTSSSLCVYCGSNAGSSPAFLEAAAGLGAALARRDISLVYGGGNVGLMGALADSVLEHGGRAIGVMPEQLVRAEIAHPGLTSLEIVASMHERKARMANLADGFVALPGGFGTFEEVLEVLTWNQLGIVAKPVVLLDVESFFAPLLAMFDAAVHSGFVRPAHRMLAQRATTVDEAVALATGPAVVTPHKWIDRDNSAPTPRP
jgi:uncharacterized protein (TIGR00730 family)